MAVEIRGTYAGNLGVELEHGPSGTRMRTAAPVDNQGDGSSFSPTDLAAAALGSCMLTLIAIANQAEDPPADLAGLAFRLEKHMAANPRRLGRLPLTLTMPAGLTDRQRTKFERAALTCPVHRSLAPEVSIEVRFDYPDSTAAG